ncbi:MAG: ornithine carbamoyltransferase [Desulfovibrionaceae bacterium]|nr:ornithine carbamoyltransferase [Desulfovibrionaceae bacterium]MDD4951707.1 ornithine carbamoyltransferase [Desulfovibrionaceae bacterium]
MTKHLLTILDLPGQEAGRLLARAAQFKAGPDSSGLLSGKTVVLVFEKSSTRTRVSFEVAVRQMGGQSLLLTPVESQLGRNEPLKDTARVLSRYCDCLVVRTFGQEKLNILAEYGSVPVINALTDDFHPCQVLSDVFTMYERTPGLEDLRVAWIGDGNNMAHSWINAAAVFPFSLHLACPDGYRPRPAILERALDMGARICLGSDPAQAARGAHYLNTDVWASMGQEGEQSEREEAFRGFQVNEALLSLAAPGCGVMHCLPAHRGEEITDQVLEGPASLIFDQAENRLHMQKAILEWIFRA